MSTLSSRLKIPYPNPSDPANVPQDMQNLATGTLDGAVMFYQSSSSSDTTVPTPSGSVQGAVSGQIWWCANPTMGQYGLNYWDGTAWRQLPDAFIGTSAPASMNATGKLWFNPSTKTLSYYDGAAWQQMIFAVSQIAPSGTNGQILTTSGGVTVWAAPATTSNIWQVTTTSITGITGYKNYLITCTRLYGSFSANSVAQQSLTVNGVTGLCQANQNVSAGAQVSLTNTYAYATTAGTTFSVSSVFAASGGATYSNSSTVLSVIGFN